MDLVMVLSLQTMFRVECDLFFMFVDVELALYCTIWGRVWLEPCPSLHGSSAPPRVQTKHSPSSPTSMRSADMQRNK
jgi:hypothetical protein